MHCDLVRLTPANDKSVIGAGALDQLVLQDLDAGGAALVRVDVDASAILSSPVLTSTPVGQHGARRLRVYMAPEQVARPAA